jgi:hypothetical protein
MILNHKTCNAKKWLLISFPYTFSFRFSNGISTIVSNSRTTFAQEVFYSSSNFYYPWTIYLISLNISLVLFRTFCVWFHFDQFDYLLSRSVFLTVPALLLVTLERRLLKKFSTVLLIFITHDHLFNFFKHKLSSSQDVLRVVPFRSIWLPTLTQV